MALIGINQYQNDTPKDSTLDKIFKGVQIAQGVMGTALIIPKFLQDRKEFQSTSAYRSAQANKFGAEQKQIEADMAPPTQGQIDDLKRLGVPMSSVRNAKDANDWIQKYSETPGQKLERENRGLTLDLAVKNSLRSDRTESRAVENTIYSRSKDEEEKAKKERERLDELSIPSLGNQTAKTAIEARDMRNAIGTTKTVLNDLDALIEQREELGKQGLLSGSVGGGTVNPGLNKLAATKAASIALSLKNPEFYNLGVLAGPDVGFIEKGIPKNPLAPSVINAAGGVDPILGAMKQTRQWLVDRMTNGFNAKGVSIPKDYFDKQGGVGQSNQINQDVNVPAGGDTSELYKAMKARGLIK